MIKLCKWDGVSERTNERTNQGRIGRRSCRRGRDKWRRWNKRRLRSRRCSPSSPTRSSRWRRCTRSRRGCWYRWRHFCRPTAVRRTRRRPGCSRVPWTTPGTDTCSCWRRRRKRRRSGTGDPDNHQYSPRSSHLGNLQFPKIKEFFSISQKWHKNDTKMTPKWHQNDMIFF